MSFDGGVCLDVPAGLPDSYRSFAERRHDTGPLIGRGQGLSYAAASFGRATTSIVTKVFDRILDYDSATGEIAVEAGITLATLFDFLLARGRYLPVQPGHDQISIGGCIAANVHGKNQARDGTFVDQVRQITLYHPHHGIVTLDRERAGRVFDLTCGGYGLTGIIVSARLATASIPGRAVALTVTPLSRRNTAPGLKEAADQGADLAYSWHDLAADGTDLLVSGRFTEQEVKHASRRATPISADWRARTVLPLHTAATGKLLNFLYRKLTPPGVTTIGLREALFPTRGKANYFRLFGRRGFHEHQSIVPLQVFPDYLERLRSLARRHRVPIALASGKHFDGASKLLRFTGTGTCFAINIARSAASPAFMGDLDKLTVTLGCRPNIIKDSRLPADVVASTYTDYDCFRQWLHEWDPKRVFRSELSDRLGL